MPDAERSDLEEGPRRLVPVTPEDSHPASPHPTDSVLAGADVTVHDKGLSRLRITGADLRQMLAMGTTLLEENVEQVNSLNVFPVPDGDTGTNMLLTMQSALAEVARGTLAEAGAVAHAAAHGALMGARGNSGVILSQILRGIARACDGKESLTSADLATALKEGANTAYRGIGRPVEGTILTVAREAGDAAVAAAQDSPSLVQMIRRTLEAARTSLESTPSLLATLREAGVVDAGGQGYVLLLEGASMFLTNQRQPAPVAQARKPGGATTSGTGITAEYGYCTELLINGSSLDVEAIRGKMEQMGSSVIVVGDSDLVHIHVHTQQPGDILNLASQFGSLDKVKVENMQVQHTSYLASRGVQPARMTGVGVVVVAVGSGFAKLFEDLGACAVVPGGQTMNPSIEELVHAASTCQREKVILLPNNPNVILTAQQAQSLAALDIQVIPTRTICEGVAAMVAFNAEAGLDANVDGMKEAAESVHTIEITRAVRSTRVNGLQVAEGQAIGLVDGNLLDAGDSVEDVVMKGLDRVGAGDHEVVTLYFGDGVSEDEGRALATRVANRWPDLQVDTVDGGQPHYPYLISVE